MEARTRLVAALAVIVLVLAGIVVGVVALTRDDAPAPDATPAVAVVAGPDVVRQQLDAGATVIDVRTPEEHEAGHVEGALLADLEGSAFPGVVADLPREAPYVVYCASGRRAAIAVEQMVEDGFTDVVNGGGFDDMTALGAPTGP